MTVLEALTLLNQKIKTVPTLSDDNKKACEYLAIANAFFELSNRGNYYFVTGYYSSNYIPQSVKDIKSKYPETSYHFYLHAEPGFRYFKWGFIDTNGSWVLQPQFANVKDVELIK
ncbi:MAG: WG repeat-containing protein [Cytophagaceae bacterium]|nr:WG repeat-containing protein [Cytophagaceae bacterium]